MIKESQTSNFQSKYFSRKLYLPEIAVFIAWISGVGYFAVRFASRDQFYDIPVLNVVVPTAVFIISTLVFAAWVRVYLSRKNWGAFHPLLRIPLAVAAFILFLLFCNAASKHFTAGLAALADINRPDGTINLWNSQGVSKAKPVYRLEELHRKGDEVAHLAAAQAVRVASAQPSAIGQLCREESDNTFRYDRKYWINRALRGHPPGLAFIYSFVCENPVFARVLALMLTILAGVMAFYAGEKVAPESGISLAFVAFFVGIPNLIWWHAASVSSDIAPCLFTFASFIVWAGVHGATDSESELSWRKIVIIALLVALGTFTTYTAALSAVAMGWLIINMTKCEQRAAKAAVIMLAAAFAVVLGIMYSRAIFGDGGHVLLSRAQTLLNGEQQGSFISGLRAAKVFLSRMPMDLGLPLVITLIGSVVALLFSDLPVWQKLVRVVTALIVLVPASMLFWPEIRFAYPGWLLVCYGLGLPELWNRLSVPGRAGLVGSVLGFSYTKFVLLRLAVPA